MGESFYAGLIEGLEEFDPAYFHLLDEDAAIMDPQARVLLKESLKGLYDAGYTQEHLAGEKRGGYA